MGTNKRLQCRQSLTIGQEAAENLSERISIELGSIDTTVLFSPCFD